MSIPTGTVLRVVASFLWTDGNVNQNVFNCLVSGGTGPWDEEDLIDDVVDWMDDCFANLVDSISDEIDGNTVTLYKWDVAGQDWDEVGSDTWAFNPTEVSEQLPRGSAGLVRLWTEDPDVQGRKFIPGLVEANLVDGLYNGALLTEMLAFGLDWYTPQTGAASGALITPGIWSVVGSLFVAAVEHYATSAIPAYQRRRKRTVGI